MPEKSIKNQKLEELNKQFSTWAVMGTIKNEEEKKPTPMFTEQEMRDFLMEEGVKIAIKNKERRKKDNTAYISWQNVGKINVFKPYYCPRCDFNIPFFIAEVREKAVHKHCPNCGGVIGSMRRETWDGVWELYHRIEMGKLKDNMESEEPVCACGTPLIFTRNFSGPYKKRERYDCKNKDCPVDYVYFHSDLESKK